MHRHEADITAGRHGGNAASAAAFAEGQPKHQAQRERILALIVAAPAGLTSKVIAARLGGIALHTFSGRITQLKADDLIEGTGTRRDGAEVLIQVKRGQRSLFN